MTEVRLHDLDAFDRAIADHPHVLLFKHSPTCPVSAAAHAEYETWRATVPSAQTLFVDVIADRQVARGIAERCGIRHESPQAVLFTAGKPVWHAAHAAVTATALERAWNASRTPTELILASTSRYRKELLERLGFPFRCVAPDVDETAVKRLGLAPRDLALELAKRKAGSVAKANPTACVIGSDQVCSLGARIFSKPGDRAGAIAQLAALSGQTHELCTAVALASGNELATHVEVTALRMRELSRAEIERCVDLDTPFDCAGSYKIEAHGIGLFAAIQSTDWNAIVGLPLLWLGQRLREHGFAGP